MSDELRGLMEKVAMDAAVKMITDGDLDDAIEEIVIKQIRDGKGNGLTEVGFVLNMAVYILDSGCPSFLAAKRRAGLAYKEFKRDNGVKFGDHGWDWTAAGAIDVAQGYEADYYEVAEEAEE